MVKYGFSAAGLGGTVIPPASHGQSGASLALGFSAEGAFQPALARWLSLLAPPDQAEPGGGLISQRSQRLVRFVNLIQPGFRLGHRRRVRRPSQFRRARVPVNAGMRSINLLAAWDGFIVIYKVRSLATDYF